MEIWHRRRPTPHHIPCQTRRSLHAWIAQRNGRTSARRRPWFAVATPRVCRFQDRERRGLSRVIRRSPPIAPSRRQLGHSCGAVGRNPAAAPTHPRGIDQRAGLRTSSDPMVRAHANESDRRPEQSRAEVSVDLVAYAHDLTRPWSVRVHAARVCERSDQSLRERLPCPDLVNAAGSTAFGPGVDAELSWQVTVEVKVSPRRRASYGRSRRDTGARRRNVGVDGAIAGRLPHQQQNEG